jgi:hypothetical protein
MKISASSEPAIAKRRSNKYSVQSEKSRLHITLPNIVNKRKPRNCLIGIFTTKFGKEYGGFLLFSEPGSNKE